MKLQDKFKKTIQKFPFLYSLVFIFLLLLSILIIFKFASNDIANYRLRNFEKTISAKIDYIRYYVNQVEFIKFKESTGVDKIYFVDRKGIITVSSEPTEMMKPADLKVINEKTMKNKIDVAKFMKEGTWITEKGKHVYYFPDGSQGLIVIEKNDKIEKKSSQTEFFTVILKYLLIMSLIIAVGLFILVLFRFILPIRRLTKYFKGFTEVMDFNYFSKYPLVYGKDESAQLNKELGDYLERTKTKLNLIEQDRSATKKVYELMKLKNMQMDSLFEFYKMLSSDVELEKIYEKTVEILMHFMNAKVVGILLVDSEGHLKTEVLKGVREYKNIEVLEPLEKAVMKAGKIHRVKDATKEKGLNLSEVNDIDRARLKEYYIVPLKTEKDSIGILIVDRVFSGKLKNADETVTLSTIGEIIGRAVSKALKFREMNIGLNITSILYKISTLVETKKELHELLKEIVKSLKKVVDYTSVSIYLINEKNELEETPEYREGDSDEILQNVEFKLGKGIKALVAHKRDTIIVEDTKKTKGFEKIFNEKIDRISSFASVPMFVEDRLIGIINLTHKEADKFKDEDKKILKLFANQIASSIEKIKKDRKIEELLARLTNETITDPLTQIYNRRYMNQRLISELERAKRENLLLGIVEMDIDFFKKVNDTYGHQAGDTVLREVADVLKNNIRVIDIPCRYGGEEFLLILPNATIEGLKILTDRMRKNIMAKVIEVTTQNGIERIGVTISMGVAIFPAHGDTVEGLIGKADAALYKAKQNGRNRVVFYGE